MGYEIGDIIKDTEDFGTVKIIDIYISPTTDDRCYKVLVDDSNMMEALCTGQVLQTGDAT